MNDVSTYVCRTCDYYVTVLTDCYRCTSTNTCVTCKNAKYLYSGNNTCLNDCPSKSSDTFYNVGSASTGNICTNCSTISNCLKCNGSANCT